MDGPRGSALRDRDPPVTSRQMTVRVMAGATGSCISRGHPSGLPCAFLGLCRRSGPEIDQPIHGNVPAVTPTEDRPIDTIAPRRSRLGRCLPLAAVILIMVAIFATGLHRHVSLETVVRHRMAIDAFIAEHAAISVGLFVAIYIAVVALSIPGAVLLTISSGMLFGTLVGGLASVIGATIGATIIFLIARSAAGEGLVRRAGPLASKIADGFCSNAFSYLLFLRLVPVFPFWIINLVPALVGVKLGTFVAATGIGIIPLTFVFALFGSGLHNALAAQTAGYKECLAAGRGDCVLRFDLAAVFTPQLIAALVAIGIVALMPAVVKHVKARKLAKHPACD